MVAVPGPRPATRLGVVPLGGDAVSVATSVSHQWRWAVSRVSRGGDRVARRLGVRSSCPHLRRHAPTATRGTMVRSAPTCVLSVVHYQNHGPCSAHRGIVHRSPSGPWSAQCPLVVLPIVNYQDHGPCSAYRDVVHRSLSRP